MSMKIKAFGLDVKSVGAKGFSGYASVFGTVDSYQERTAFGAFAESLAEAAAKGRKFPVLFQHDHNAPIGTWTKLEEDEHGLYGEAELWLEDSPTARVAYRGLKDRSISGLSIGYYPRSSTLDEETQVRTLTAVDFVEASIVLAPSNDDARVGHVRAKMARGEVPSLSEFEVFLRDAGISRKAATTIASRGLKHLLSDSGSANEPDLSALIEQVKSFNLSRG